LQWHQFLDVFVDVFPPEPMLRWRRAFCKAPFKKSTSIAFSASKRFSWRTSFRWADACVLGRAASSSGLTASSLVRHLYWDDFSEAFPAFLTLIATPLTFSIATGFSLGMLSFTFVKVGTGRYREISPLIWILSALFLLRYAFLGTE
jgi:hypothetical protein